MSCTQCHTHMRAHAPYCKLITGNARRAGDRAVAPGSERAVFCREHFEVASGFGASDTVFTTSNYGGNKTTPRHECLHVVSAVPDSSASHHPSP